MALELAEVEQAREDVEQELAQAGADGVPLGAAEVDELVKKAAQLGWYLAKLGTPGVTSDVVVDRSGERPVVRSPAHDAFREMAMLSFEREAKRRDQSSYQPLYIPYRPGE